MHQGENKGAVKNDMFSNYEAQVQAREKQREEWRLVLIQQMQDSESNHLLLTFYRCEEGQIAEEEARRRARRGKGTQASEGVAG